jgi:hypothetical protein
MNIKLYSTSTDFTLQYSLLVAVHTYIYPHVAVGHMWKEKKSAKKNLPNFQPKTDLEIYIILYVAIYTYFVIKRHCTDKEMLLGIVCFMI